MTEYGKFSPEYIHIIKKLICRSGTPGGGTTRQRRRRQHQQQQQQPKSVRIKRFVEQLSGWHLEVVLKVLTAIQKTTKYDRSVGLESFAWQSRLLGFLHSQFYVRRWFITSSAMERKTLCEVVDRNRLPEDKFVASFYEPDDKPAGSKNIRDFFTDYHIIKRFHSILTLATLKFISTPNW